MEGISVIIPLYNKAETISRAVHSVQDSAKCMELPVEIIVVNDASTDLKDAHIENLIELNIQWIVLSENKGVSHARNTGIARAKYKWIGFLDADDFWEPNFLAEVTRILNTHPQTDLISSGYQVLKGNSLSKYFDAETNAQIVQYRGEDYFDIACFGITPIMISSVVVKKETIMQANCFPESTDEAEDLWLWSKLAMIKARFIFLNQCLVTVDANYSTERSRLHNNIDPFPHLKMISNWYDQNNKPISTNAKYYIASYKTLLFFRLVTYQPKYAKRYLQKELESDIPPISDWRVTLLQYLPIFSYQLIWRFNEIKNLVKEFGSKNENLIPLSRSLKS